MGKKANGKETEIAVDGRKVLKLAKFHRIRPLLFEYDKKTSLLAIKNKEYLKIFVTQNALKNLKDIYHTKKLLQQFETAGIPAILHKGLQYQFEIYENPQLRERGDIDVLVQKKDVLPSMNVLKDQGFGSEILNPDQPETEIGQHIEKLLSFNYLYQLPVNNKSLLLDFQWGVKSDFHSFHFPYPLIFHKATLRDSFAPSCRPFCFYENLQYSNKLGSYTGHCKELWFATSPFGWISIFKNITIHFITCSN